MTSFAWSPALCNARLEDLTRFFGEAGAVPNIAACHVDLGDGRFAPGFAAGSSILAALSRSTTLPIDIHAQMRDADGLVTQLLNLDCASITLPVESLVHAHRALAAIRASGRQPGIAIGAATPLTTLEYLLPSVDRILLLARDPGERPAPLRPAFFERVKILRENVDYHRRKIMIEVEGAAAPEDIAALIAHGASRFVLDDLTLLNRTDFVAAARDLAEDVAALQHVV